MRRNVIEIPLDDDYVKIRVRLVSDDVRPKTSACEYAQANLLQMAASNFDLLNCGYSRFDTLKMWFDGDRWVIEAEATVRKQNGDQQNSSDKRAQ